MNNSDTSIYINGRIFTADDQNPYADSMIISGGRIRWIGKQEDLPETKGTVVDLKGRRVIPGFVDAHMHPVMLAAMMSSLFLRSARPHAMTWTGDAATLRYVLCGPVPISAASTAAPLRWRVSTGTHRIHRAARSSGMRTATPPAF